MLPKEYDGYVLGDIGNVSSRNYGYSHNTIQWGFIGPLGNGGRVYIEVRDKHGRPKTTCIEVPAGSAIGVTVEAANKKIEPEEGETR